MLISLLSLVAIVLCIGMVLLIRKRGWFQPGIVFLVMAIVDVLFPALYWVTLGQVNNPEWLPALTEAQIHAAVLFYIPFLVIFILALLASDRQKAVKYQAPVNLPKLEYRLLLIASFGLLLAAAQIAVEVIARGGLQSWFWSKFIFSAGGDENLQAGAGGILSIFPVREVFQALAGIGFYFRLQFNRKFLFTVIFPGFAVSLAMLTFLRGSLLACAMTFVFAELMRQRKEGRVQYARGKNKAFIASLMVVFMSIYAYGAVRDGFRGLASGDIEEKADIVVPTFLTAGHGLLGLSHIMANYGVNVDYLNGKTYLDMLLLPVPRSIYTSKPDWYGIDDITRGMGWPDTTQSAVTMPGEAFANFGLSGLLVALPLGLIVGLLHRAITSTEVSALLLGPTVFFQIPAVANWMAFTGIMNSLPLVVILFSVAWYIRASQSSNSVQLFEYASIKK